ncbi:hypothetical protein Btru_049915 [Bulinus truncatus]|nr:hypothetical protein Btru_049915 [Bulinus truncatus]
MMNDGRTHDSSYDVEMIHFINWWVVFIITPIVSVFGVVGNCISVAVLTRLGIKKTSDILLVSLAISDISFMVGANSPFKLIYQWGSMEGFVFTEGVSWLCFCLYHTFDIMDWGGGLTSVGLPVLITLERFVAVFFPLKSKIIVTKRRTIAAVMICYFYCYGIQIYIRFWYEIDYVYNELSNETIALIGRSHLYWQQRTAAFTIEEMFSSSFAPLSVVGVGCVGIGIRLRLATSRRLQMTNSVSVKCPMGSKSHPAPSRTTKTLLAVCSFYCVSCVFISLPNVLPKDAFFPIFSEAPSKAAVLVYNVLQLILCINGLIPYIGP